MKTEGGYMPTIEGIPLEVPGKLIALYGINRLGKSTQRQMLAERIKQELDVPVETIKYPAYKVPPSGPRLNAYLREGNPEGLTPREFQILNVLNRTQTQPSLELYLATGHVIVEDYWGTGVAWGVAYGVGEAFLIDLNSHLIKEDIAILFDGVPFPTGAEEGHLHEEDTRQLMHARTKHLRLQQRFGWHVIKTNHPKEAVHSCLWNLVAPILRS